MEDLNQLYYRHQLALMRAQSSTKTVDRDAHVDRARAYGDRINVFQRKRFAEAGWPNPALI